MRLFHRHKVDPEKWKLVSAVETMRTPRPLDELTGMPQSTLPVPRGKQIVYSNTCTDCGDLIFRRVKEIE